MQFIDTLTHPNHKKLAQALLDGASHASLYPEYGKTRVQQMAERIKSFDPNKPTSKALGCKHCGVSGLCKIK